MEKDKKLSAARKKLQEYKLSKGAIPPGVGTTVHSLDETAPPTEAPTNGQSSYAVQEAFHYPPPPRSMSSQEGTSVGGNQKVEEIPSGYPAAPMIPPIQTSVEVNYSAAGLFDTSSDRHEGSPVFAEMKTNGTDTGVVNLEGSPNAEQTSFLPSPTASSYPSNTFVPTPSAPPLASELFKANQPQGRFTDAGQDFPVNFFQPTPVAQQYQPVSFNSNLFQQPNSSPQDFIYNSPQTPLFFNVDGSNNAPLSPPPLTTYPQQEPSNPNDSYTNPVAVTAMEDGNREGIIVEPSSGGINVNASENTEDVETGQTFQQSIQADTETNGLHVPPESEKSTPASSPFDIQSLIPSSPILREPPLRTSTPSSRKLSEASQDEKDRQEIQLLQRMQSVQDALELQLEELRRDNKRLSDSKSELSSQLENCEKNIQELRRERDRAREDAKKLVQPLHTKINALYEENQKIIKNSSDVGMELRMKLQDKSKQHEDMEQALIVVTKSKMDLAAELDQEKERAKELEIIVAKQAEEIAILRSSNFKLEERVKVDQQKDAILHQMEDQRRHFQVQTETLQQELAIVRDKLRKSSAGSPSIEAALSPNMGVSQTATIQHDGHSCDSHGPNHQHPHVPDVEGHSQHHEHPHNAVKAHDSAESHQHCHGQDDHGHSHDHSHEGQHHPHDGHDHSHGHGHDHSHDHGHGHDHSHDHGHGHGHDHSHDHDHGHGHDHSHDHDHGHGHDHSHDHNHSHTKHTLPPEQSKNPLEEMKRRLHHLEWENSTFKSDVDKLATEAKDKKQYEAKCIKLQEECDKLREECRRLESLVIQLQGENDTIGDYIALYQSQRLALKESAKEKDVQLENLAKEREVLVAKMGELTQLLRELKGPSAGDGAADANQAGHVCMGHHHNHTPSSEPGTQPSKEIEGKIMNLLTEISSSSLIENFHPCAVCSGRLMNV